MKYLYFLKSIFLSLIILACFTNCSTDNVDSDNELSSITVTLKSTVGELDKVYLEFEDVEFRVKEDANEPNAWLSLNAINSGTYNIYNLRNDSELLLVDNFEMKSTYIYEIRLVLGDNNFMDINNTLFGFDVTEEGNSKPSNLVQLELTPNHIYNLEIVIDIDESVSFNEEANMMVLNPKLYIEIRKIQY